MQNLRAALEQGSQIVVSSLVHLVSGLVQLLYHQVVGVAAEASNSPIVLQCFPLLPALLLSRLASVERPSLLLSIGKRTGGHCVAQPEVTKAKYTP